MIQTVETYQDDLGKWYVRIIREDGVSLFEQPTGRTDKHDALTDFFGVYFGMYDDSFLELYQEWNPEDNGQSVPSSEVVGDTPSVEEQAGSVTNG